MKTADIEQGIKDTIDQFYQGPGAFIKDAQLHYIGGILQVALHLLPQNRYYAIKQYIYDAHGYDPGGVVTGQISINDLIYKKD